MGRTHRGSHPRSSNDCVLGGGVEKSQHIWGKIKFNSIDIAWKGRNSVLSYSFTQEFVPMKRSQESALHLIFFQGESKHMLSRLAAQRICEKKFFK